MRSRNPPMMSDRMDLKTVFFASSDYQGNNHGFNMNPGRIYPEQAQEIARRPTSNAPKNLSEESLVMSAKRASELMQNVGTIRPFARMLVKIYKRMGISSNHDLHFTLRGTRDNKDLEDQFVNQFNAAWSCDHEYFQRMIERDNRTNQDISGEMDDGTIG